MLPFILKRFAQAIPVLFVISTLTFFGVRLAPGGPFDEEKRVPETILKALNEKYHLSAPLHEQYFRYLGDLAHLDLGPSFKYPGRTVNEIIGQGFPITAELGLWAMGFALLLGLTAGLIAALRPNSLSDYLPMSFAMAGICIPSFVLGPLLVLIFGIGLDIFPIRGWESPIDRVLPAITLGSAYAAYIARLTRGSLLEVLAQDFIRTARAKGVSEGVLVFKHALRGGVAPVVSFLGPAFAGLLSGSLVVETIFEIPGLGRYFVQAAFNRDYTMVLGTVLFSALLIILFNLIVDIVLVWLDPRLAYK